MNGNIILLNGTSSAGKTSIVRALQELFEEPYLDAGIDRFLWMLPKRYLNEARYWHEVMAYHYEADGRLTIRSGPRGFQVMSGMHQSIATLSRAGNHVVADHVLLEPQWVQECAALFADLPAWFIAVRCPLNVLEQRERERQDRTLGQARAQFDVVHAHGLYDFEVDTSRYSALDCARQIKQVVESGVSPTAFKQLAG